MAPIMKALYLSLSAAAFLLVATTAGAANRIENPGFETGDLTGWSTFGQGWRCSSGEDTHSGDSGVVNDVLDTDSDEWRGIYQNIPVSAGATCSAKVSIRAVNIHSSSSWLELQWLDEDGSVIEQLQSPWVTDDQSFKSVKLDSVVAPPGTVTASVRGVVSMPSLPEDGAEFHIFDDFVFRSKP